MLQRPINLCLAAAAVLAAVTLGCASGPQFADGTNASAPPTGNWRPPKAEAFAIAPDRVPPVAARPRMDMVPDDLLALRGPAMQRPWRWIVIHHSATHGGGAARFDADHRARGWDELGYHFVIGNGTDTADGLIEVGSRWNKQKHGAHAKTGDNRFNELGIGICVVGNFEQSRPTPQQMKALTKLVASLMASFEIPPTRVIGHSDTKTTACPGEQLHAQMPALRRSAAYAVARARSRDGIASTR